MNKRQSVIEPLSQRELEQGYGGWIKRRDSEGMSVGEVRLVETVLALRSENQRIRAEILAAVEEVVDIRTHYKIIESIRRRLGE